MNNSEIKNVENDNKNEQRKIKMNKKAESNVIIIAVLIVCIIIATVIILFSYNKQMKQHHSLFDYDKELVLDEDKLTDEQKNILGIDKKSKKNEDELDYNLYDGDDKFTKKLSDEETKKIKEDNYSHNYKIYDSLTDEQKEKSEVIPEEEKIPDEKLDEIKEEINVEEDIPRKFNLNDKIQIKVEDQKDYGLCWAFASTKSLETYMALHENKFYDFSEIHVDYLMSDLMFGGSRQIHDAAYFGTYWGYLKKFGPINSDTLEYRDYTSDEYLNFLNYEPVVNVTKTISFPESPAQKDNSTKEEIEGFRKLVKTHIMQNGALVASIPTPYYQEDYFNFQNDAQYYDGQTSLQYGFHDVSIVGWDDEYPKEKFSNASGSLPKENGAYIALNSWGNYGNHQGYFYISYEDFAVENDLHGILSTSKDDYIRIDNIKSEAIKNFLYDGYHYYIENIDGNDYINPIVFDGQRYINLSNSGLTNEDLAELNIFSNLNKIDFDLSNNNLTDLSLLTEYKNKYNVEQIIISDNKISDLTPIKDFNNVSLLNAENNEIEDISPLSNIKELRSLQIDNNKVSDLSPLKDLKKLYSIYAKNNKVSDINSLNDFNISYIDLSGNLINWQESKYNNTSIYFLDISNTNLDSLQKLENLENLNTLVVGNNSLENLEGLEKLHINYLDISGNKIKDWSLINKLKVHKPNTDFYYKPEVSLTANNCEIEDISVFSNTDISTLILNNNKIRSLSSFHSDKLRYLHLINNDLENISGFDAPHVSYIDLSKNPKVSGLESIKDVPTVILSDNSLTNLNEVKKLTGVMELDLSRNSIKDLSDLSGFENLYTLSIEENKNIDISTISNKLSMLNAQNCDIQKSIEYSDIKNLDYLNISGNNIFIDLDSFINNIEEGKQIIIDYYDKTISLSDIEKAQNSKKVYFNSNTVSVPYNPNETTIDLPYDSWLQKEIRNSIFTLKTNDLEINDNATSINITGDNPYIDKVGLVGNNKIVFNKTN